MGLMGLMIIYFTSLSALLLLALLPTEARTFPGDDGKTVVIIYETRSSSSSLLQPLDLSAVLSALTKYDVDHPYSNDDDGKEMEGRVSRPGPIPKPTPPSPKPDTPITELTSDHITGAGEVVTPFDEGEGRKKLTPPPAPKPDSPTHYIAPRERAPPSAAVKSSAWSSLLSTYV